MPSTKNQSWEAWHFRGHLRVSPAQEVCKDHKIYSLLLDKFSTAARVFKFCVLEEKCDSCFVFSAQEVAYWIIVGKVTWTEKNWNKVIFSAEKKFGLDGSGGSQWYWHITRKGGLLLKCLFGRASLTSALTSLVTYLPLESRVTSDEE